MRGRPTAGDDPVKRRQILEGARRVFVSAGFDAASMNDITRESGVSKSTLYVYYRSKEELFRALVADERERTFSGFGPIFADTAHPERALFQFGMSLVELSISPAAVRAKRTVIAVASRMPTLGRDFYREGPARAHSLLVDYLEAAVARGRLVIDDFDLAASQFIDLSGAGLVRRALFDDAAPEVTRAQIEKTVSAAVRVFLASYGAELPGTVHPPPRKLEPTI